MRGLSQKVTGSAHGWGQTKRILSENSLYGPMLRGDWMSPCVPGRKTCDWPHIRARSAGAKRQREALRREAAAYGVAYLALQRVIPLQNEHLYTGVS